MSSGAALPWATPRPSRTWDQMLRGSQLQAAPNLQRTMAKLRAELYAIPYSATVGKYEKGGQWQAAFGLLHTMAESCLEPDTTTCSAAVGTRGGARPAAARARAIAPHGQIVLGA
eukprot:7890379-Alexandrium_andersonii.AAC.1